MRLLQLLLLPLPNLRLRLRQDVVEEAVEEGVVEGVVEEDRSPRDRFSLQGQTENQQHLQKVEAEDDRHLARGQVGAHLAYPLRVTGSWEVVEGML